MTPYPTKLALVEAGQLRIEWSDGQSRRYTCRELRDRCPCATCREEHSQSGKKTAPLLPIISEAQAQPLRIARMTPVGNYAYAIAFSDGHDTGIYTLELLRELGQAVPPPEAGGG